MVEAKIEVLDGVVADQIAAGEVVERPASVVKELVENSLDAGATRVQLHIDKGGTRLIRVLDNGRGIPEGQAALAFERHATSKMKRLEDLESVATFGFRGEALPSIVSVSRLTLRTRQAEAVAGTMVVFEGGRHVETREVGCPVGCDIEVRDLFFNTPARLKFLKKESTESSHCAEALVRLAALRPDVSFTMFSGQRKTRELPRVEAVEERIQSMFAGERMVRADGVSNGVDVLAVLGAPERARAGAGSLYTYVNNRYIRDKILLRAVTQAFAGILEPGRYPVGLIALSVPAGGIDVNVHPQKTEVRFADAQAVYRAVASVVGSMVERAAWSFGSMEPEVAADTPAAPYEAAREEPYRPEGRLVPLPMEPPRPSAPMGERPALPADEPRAVAPPPDAPRPLFHVPSGGGRRQFSDLRFLSQAKGLFLLLEDADDLVIVDQHAAHERVTYERLRKELATGRIASQRLLVTSAVDLGPRDAERVAEMEAELALLGMEVSRSGPDRVTIHAVPALLTGASPERLLADMVLAVEQGRKGSKGEFEDKVIATMACHTSIRAGRSVERREIDTLLEAMDKVDFAGYCPHGRPVLTRIPWREIRRRLGRS